MVGETHLVNALKEKGLTVSTAESLTAGMVASTIVKVPGASAVFKCGFITYASATKISVLEVPAELVAEKGVVSAEVAAAMAEGACKVGETNVGISTTGNAGPDVLENKPVGRVYTAICINGVTTVTEHNFSGDRESIRRQTTNAAIRECANRVAEFEG